MRHARQPEMLKYIHANKQKIVVFHGYMERYVELRHASAVEL